MKNIVAISLLLLCVSSCSPKKQEVVIYTALDRMHSEPLLKKFEEKTGINVKPVFDTEATKTAGLVNRLIAEKDRPVADVFWNNEIVRTIMLKKKDLLQPYKSPSSAEIPVAFKDKDGYWTGFAARARIFIVNTDNVAEDSFPRSIYDFQKPEWKGKFCIANPLFGTTSTHSAVLFTHLGDDSAFTYFKKLKENSAAVLAGNATNKDRVVAGIYRAGFTDTDDANLAVEAGKPVAMVFPDQEGMGTLLIPNTVAMIKNCPHTEAAKKLIDFILSKEVEVHLAASSSAQIPVRKGIKGPKNLPAIETIKVMAPNWERAADKLEEATKKLEQLLLK